MPHKQVETIRRVAEQNSYPSEYPSFVETPVHRTNILPIKKSNIWTISSCLYLLLDFE
jgi:hypothetical protein